MNRNLKSFKYAVNGLRIAWAEEINFKIETIIAVLVVIFMFYFDFSYIEKIICLLCISFVLTVEIINTVVEDLCNKIQPNTDPIIARIKDLSSGAVLVSSVGSLLIGFSVFYNHFI